MLVLIATHAAVVKAFSVLNGAELVYGWCPFCAYTAIENRGGKEWKMIHDEDDSYVSPKL